MFLSSSFSQAVPLLTRVRHTWSQKAPEEPPRPPSHLTNQLHVIHGFSVSHLHYKNALLLVQPKWQSSTKVISTTSEEIRAEHLSSLTNQRLFAKHLPREFLNRVLPGRGHSSQPWQDLCSDSLTPVPLPGLLLPGNPIFLRIRSRSKAAMRRSDASGPCGSPGSTGGGNPRKGADGQWSEPRSRTGSSQWCKSLGTKQYLG